MKGAVCCEFREFNTQAFPSKLISKVLELICAFCCLRKGCLYNKNLINQRLKAYK